MKGLPPDIPELKRRTRRLRNRIKKMAEAKYDARPLIDPYWELRNKLEELGVKNQFDSKILHHEYWEDPETYCNDAQNKWPIAWIKDGDFEVEYKKKRDTPKVEIKETNIVATPKPKESYYKINIVGIEDDETLNRIKQFFNGMNLAPINNNECGYVFKGTEEGFTILRNAVTVLMDILANQQFKIEIYGKKISI